MNKRLRRHYNASERAGMKRLKPATYRPDKSVAGPPQDQNGTKRVSQIHSKVISEHTRGLVTFSGDQIVLAVDPAKYRGVAS